MQKCLLFSFFIWSLVGPIFSPVSMKLIQLLFIIEGMGNFVANLFAVLKDVHRFGKHAFISDSSDDFRFCPRSSIQINPSFEFSGHLPIHFVDDAVPEKKTDFLNTYQENSRKYVSLILMFQFYKILFLKGRK